MAEDLPHLTNAAQRLLDAARDDGATDTTTLPEGLEARLFARLAHTLDLPPSVLLPTSGEAMPPVPVPGASSGSHAGTPVNPSFAQPAGVGVGAAAASLATKSWTASVWGKALLATTLVGAGALTATGISTVRHAQDEARITELQRALQQATAARDASFAELAESRRALQNTAAAEVTPPVVPTPNPSDGPEQPMPGRRVRPRSFDENRTGAAVATDPSRDSGAGAPDVSPPSPGAAVGSTAGNASTSSLAAESLLLERARVGLIRGDAQASLEAIRLHALRYSRGVLAEERDALWIQALLAAGQRRQATQRFEQFNQDYPGSPLRSGIEGVFRNKP